MIVTLCGAYRNSGDHLIGDRARALLREHVSSDIVVVDRKAIEPGHYDAFNRARAVLLTGGPAYQRAIYPKVYPLELSRITAPVIPYGLGWKAPVGKAVETFKFEPEAEQFIRDVHARVPWSSARDPLTVQALSQAGVNNVLMTGCPAWYDLASFEQTYAFNEEVKSLVLSMPAQMQPGVRELMEWLTERFPKARRVASFHHGFIPSDDKVGRERAIDFARFSAHAIRRGWRSVSLAGSLEKMQNLYLSADFHIGYRVHAHLLCLSRRIASILINEDTRGAGQAHALGAPSLDLDKTGDVSPIIEAVEFHFKSRGQTVMTSIETMRATYPVMKRFLATL